MHRTLGRFLAYRAGVAAALYVAALVLIAIVTQFLPGVDPQKISDEVMREPSLQHLLGTDELGRDVFTGILFGTQVSVTVGFAAALGDWLARALADADETALLAVRAAAIMAAAAESTPPTLTPAWVALLRLTGRLRSVESWAACG